MAERPKFVSLQGLTPEQLTEKSNSILEAYDTVGMEPTVNSLYGLAKSYSEISVAKDSGWQATIERVWAQGTQIGLAIRFSKKAGETWSNLRGTTWLDKSCFSAEEQDLLTELGEAQAADPKCKRFLTLTGTSKVLVKMGYTSVSYKKDKEGNPLDVPVTYATLGFQGAIWLPGSLKISGMSTVKAEDIPRIITEVQNEKVSQDYILAVRKLLG